jgi:hypothetical protein
MSGSNGYLAYFTDAVAGSGLTYDVQGNRFEVGSYVVGTHATTGSLSGAFTWVDNALSNGTTVGL